MVADVPAVTVFKPQGVPMGQLYGVVLGLDGFEALRLVDGEGLSQEEAAARMRVSRPTLCRILAEARTQVARALSRGWAIRIDTDGEHAATFANTEQDMAPYCRRAQGCVAGSGRRQGGGSCRDVQDEEERADAVRADADRADAGRADAGGSGPEPGAGAAAGPDSGQAADAGTDRA